MSGEPKAGSLQHIRGELHGGINRNMDALQREIPPPAGVGVRAGPDVRPEKASGDGNRRRGEIMLSADAVEQLIKRINLAEAELSCLANRIVGPTPELADADPLPEAKPGEIGFLREVIEVADQRLIALHCTIARLRDI